MSNQRCPAGKRKVKMDLHMHASEDPIDSITYSARELLDTAHKKGFEVLAITLHCKVLWDESLFRRARELGILLIPGIELRLEDCDVLAYNVTPAEALHLKTFADLKKLRAERGTTMMTMAPHPYYVLGGSMGKRLTEHIDAFDAVEYCHFHTWLINPNWPASRVAKKYGLPMVATSDAHRLDAFGNHYSWVEIEGEPTTEKVMKAIRQNCIETHSPGMSLVQLLKTLFFIKVTQPYRKWRRRKGNARLREVSTHA